MVLYQTTSLGHRSIPHQDQKKVCSLAEACSNTINIGQGQSQQESINIESINIAVLIFGQNSSLDVGGSFVATTASAIAFNNQGFFTASAPNVPSLLTVN